MTTLPDQILALADAGHTPAEIVSLLDTPVSLSTVYTVLRANRPNRPRSARRRTSSKPDQIRALVASGVACSRVTALLGVTRQYVYRVVKEGAEA